MKRRTWLNIASTALIVARDGARAQTAQTHADAAPYRDRTVFGTDASAGAVAFGSLNLAP